MSPHQANETQRGSSEWVEDAPGALSPYDTSRCQSLQHWAAVVAKGPYQKRIIIIIKNTVDSTAVQMRISAQNLQSHDNRK